MDNTVTQGQYVDEVNQVHPIIKNSWLNDYFTIYHDQEETFVNQFLLPKLDNDGKGHKGFVDFVLIPNKRAIEELGWTDGCIQIECKKSNQRIGKPIAQAMDYQNSIIKFNKTGVQMKPSWTFIFPVENIRGNLSSVMTQNRIGYGMIDSKNNVKLRIGESNFLSIYNGDVKYRSNSKVGNKQGSR